MRGILLVIIYVLILKLLLLPLKLRFKADLFSKKCWAGYFLILRLMFGKREFKKRVAGVNYACQNISGLEIEIENKKYQQRMDIVACSLHSRLSCYHHYSASAAAVIFAVSMQKAWYTHIQARTYVSYTYTLHSTHRHIGHSRYKLHTA